MSTVHTNAQPFGHVFVPSCIYIYTLSVSVTHCAACVYLPRSQKQWRSVVATCTLLCSCVNPQPKLVDMEQSVTKSKSRGETKAPSNFTRGGFTFAHSTWPLMYAHCAVNKQYKQRFRRLHKEGACSCSPPGCPTRDRLCQMADGICSLPLSNIIQSHYNSSP